MKVIKESVNTQYEVGLIPAGTERYKTLEEPLGVFETFDAAKECVLSYNHIINTEYAGYDIVVVSSGDDYQESDWASDSEVYRLDGTPLNEGVLNEGPISWAKQKIAKGAAKRALSKAEKEQKNVRAQANSVLAKDFKKDCQNAKFYIDGNFKKAYTQDEWIRMFGDIVRNNVTSGEDYEKWYNAIVTTPDNYILRRGAEDCSKRLEKLVPGKNDTIGDRYKMDTKPVAEPEETPVESPAEAEVSTSDAAEGAELSPENYAKFAVLSKVTGVKVIGPRGGVVTKLSVLKKIDNTNADKFQVEVEGKRFKLSEYVKMLKDKKLLEEVSLTEKVWKHKISTEVAFRLRDILESDDTDYEGLRDAIKACYDDIHAAMPEVFDESDCEDAKEELDWLSTSVDDSDADFDDPEYMDDDDLENEWNYALEDLYDLCDNLDIWIPVRGIDESFLQDIQKDHKAIERNYGKEVYDALDEYIALGNDLGDVLYNESKWNEFVEWLKNSKGIDLPEARESSFLGLDEDLTDANAYKIVYHKNTACKDRRPETADDVEDDWTEAPVRADSDLDALQRAIAIIHDCDVEDVIDDGFDSEASCISYLEEADWGDGLPIIIKVEGPDGALFDTGYDKESWIEEFCEAEDYDTYEECLKSRKKTLTEAPIIKLNDADIMNPAKLDFKQKIADAKAEEEAEKARQAEEARKEQFRAKYKDVPAKLEASLGKGADVEETLEVLFGDLVPGQGTADTVAGEMVRAMMRVLYRDYNDGDKFFMGYGLETCASSVSYLCAHITAIEKRVEKMLDEAFRYEDDDRYTEALKEMTGDVVDHIMNNQELIFTPNEDDSRDYDYSYIEENQPRYEFECDGSDDVCTLVDNGVINGWDLYHYVEDALQWDNAYEGAEVERPWGYDSTSITVSNLTIEGYEQLKDSFESHRDGWWEDLVSEHKEELDRINNDDDDYEEDDDIDEGLINARPELRHIAEKLQAKSEDLTFLANEFDKALTSEGFNYYIDIVEGFKINVESDDLKAIDDFANDFFKKYDLAVDIEDKGASHNYMLKKAKTQTSKNEGYVDAFKPMKEKLNEEFLSYEDVMQGMMDNASNEQIDGDIRMFNKVAKNLGLKRPEDIVIYVDGEGMYDPGFYADSGSRLDKVLSKFTCGPIECIAERKNGNVWIYFATQEDADRYIRFVNTENGL